MVLRIVLQEYQIARHKVTDEYSLILKNTVWEVFITGS
jgi:hypothetical protein